MSCFGAGPGPAVAFQWTADKTAATSFKFAVEATAGSDELIVEVFGDATCAQTSLLDCGQDKVGGLQPVLYKDIVAGKTYTIVVLSRIAPAPAGPFTLRLGD